MEVIVSLLHVYSKQIERKKKKRGILLFLLPRKMLDFIGDQKINFELTGIVIVE